MCLFGFALIVVAMHGGQRRIFFWLNLTRLLRRLLRSTRHAKKRHTVPRLTLELNCETGNSFVQPSCRSIVAWLMTR